MVQYIVGYAHPVLWMLLNYHERKKTNGSVESLDGKMTKKKEKIKLSKKIHYWFCDLFNVVSKDDFYALLYDFDRVLGSLNNFIVAQTKFNKVVAEKLSLSQKDFLDDATDEYKKKNAELEKDSLERMFG